MYDKCPPASPPAIEELSPYPLVMCGRSDRQASLNITVLRVVGVGVYLRLVTMCDMFSLRNDEWGHGTNGCDEVTRNGGGFRGVAAPMMRRRWLQIWRRGHRW